MGSDPICGNEGWLSRKSAADELHDALHCGQCVINEGGRAA